MNGCYRTQAEIEKNVCNCPKYNESKGTCESDLDTVSKKDGQPMCPKNPDAIQRVDYNRVIENKKNGVVETTSNPESVKEIDLTEYVEELEFLDEYFPYGTGYGI